MFMTHYYVRDWPDRSEERERKNYEIEFGDGMVVCNMVSIDIM